MKLDDKPEIDEKWFDENYTVSSIDIAMTGVCQLGHCSVSNDNLLKAILYLYGMDIKRGFKRISLDEGASHRSQFSGEIQKGGVIYSGYVRTDNIWLEKGKQNMIKFLWEDLKWLG